MKNEIFQRIWHILVRIIELTGWKASINVYAQCQLYTVYTGHNPHPYFKKKKRKMASKLPFRGLDWTRQSGKECQPWNQIISFTIKFRMFWSYSNVMHFMLLFSAFVDLLLKWKKTYSMRILSQVAYLFIHSFIHSFIN